MLRDFPRKISRFAISFCVARPPPESSRREKNSLLAKMAGVCSFLMKPPAFSPIRLIQTVVCFALATGLPLVLAAADEPKPAEQPVTAQPAVTKAPALVTAKPARVEGELVTGSRLPQKPPRLRNVNAPATAFPVVIITREQLDRTGRPTVAGALSRSPAVR